MERELEVQVKASLTGAIRQWLENDDSGGRGGFPWMGDNVAEIMAEAALQVLRGMADAQAYMVRENMLTD
jgi:hypothetical protein